MTIDIINTKYPNTSFAHTNEKELDLGRPDLNQAIRDLGGLSVENGLFRIHTFQTSIRWRENIETAFPKYTGKIGALGMDWMGRQFAYALKKDFVILFDISTGEDLVLEQTISEFLTDEIVRYGDDTFGAERARKFLSSDRVLNFDEIIGFKVPLYLGGKDEDDNLEFINADVDWEINRQLMA